MTRLSIRWRLTLWNTFALASLLVVVGSLVYAWLRHAMYEQLDRTLAVQFREIEQDDLLASDVEARLRHWVDEFHDHVGVYSAVYDEDGGLVARTEQLAQQSVPPSSLPPAGAHFASIDLPLIGRQRTVTRTFEAEGRRFAVTLMLPLDETDRELNQAAAALLTVFPIALLLAGGVAYVLARKALAPVDRIRRATDEINAERLDRRLDLANPDDEFGRLAQTINSLIARLERSFAEIRRFTADASHELRTPLAVIRAETEVAMNRPPVAGDFQGFAGNILEECERLTRLTDQLLILSREDAGIGAGEHEVVDLTDLTANAVDLMRPLAEAKRQTMALTRRAKLKTIGDAARLRQVVYNLLDNAIKYTPEDGRIDVELVEQEQMATLTVRDNGVGISPEHLPHVLKRFYRVDKARTREEGGSGLGLSIVDSIVAAHGGFVRLASDPGVGTAVTVLLPLPQRRGET